MRTTLTLDADVAALLERVTKRRGTTVKATVNEALRRGLAELASRRTPAEPFAVAPWDLGGSLVGSLDNVEEVLSRVEGEKHR